MEKGLAEVRPELAKELGSLRPEIAKELGRVRIEMAEGFGKIQVDLARRHADLLKWIFIFWASTLVLLAGVAIALAKL